MHALNFTVKISHIPISNLELDPFRWDLSLLQRCQDGVVRGDDRSSDFKVKVLHREHARTIYGIASANGNDVVTVGQDR